jgi:hypothetical protein
VTDRSQFEESSETKIARIDERTARIEQKLEEHCTWKNQASIDLGILKDANLPKRVSKLEGWAKYRDGALALLLLLVGAGRIFDIISWLTLNKL